MKTDTITISALSYKLLTIFFLASFLAACDDDKDDNKTAIYKVTFNTDGGAPEVDDQAIVGGERAQQPISPTKTGFEFSGWVYTVDSQEKPYNFSAPVTSNLDLKAIYKKIYTVAFNADGGSPSPPDQTIVQGQKATPPPNPEKTGFQFSGWANTVDNPQQPYNFSAPVTSDLDLKAVYVKTYTIAFDTDGGSPPRIDQTIVQGQTATPPTNPDKAGFDFTSWINTENNRIYDFSTPVSADLTLKATYTIQSYTVRFELNEGAPALEDRTLEYGQTLTEPDPPTRYNKMFAGWYTDAMFTKPYDFDASVTGEMTLYAQWKNYNIPDRNFRQRLKRIVPNAFDGEQLKTEDSSVETLVELNVGSRNIASLEGIQYFKGLTKLICDYNDLKTLDVSQNKALKELSCFRNKLTSLDVSGATDLDTLVCYSNKLTSLDVSQNTALIKLNCSGNTLKELDVSNNMNLQILNCATNKLTSLDVSNNTALEELRCERNQLASLNVLGASALTELSCQGNQLETLDIHSNTELVIFSIISNTQQAYNSRLAEIHLNQKFLCVYEIQEVLLYNKDVLDITITSYDDKGDFLNKYSESAYAEKCSTP